jgi:hypothetical protein
MTQKMESGQMRMIPIDQIDVLNPRERNKDCPRQSKSEPSCRPNIEPGWEADVLMVGCA